MKKVLLIVSDGADNRSKHSLKDIVKDADSAGVLIYTIGLFDENSEDKNPGVLKQARAPDGRTFYLPSDLSQLSNICSQIAKDIRNQYTIGYSSQKASLDSAFHDVKLTAVDAQGKPLRVRTRTGFYGAKATASLLKHNRSLALLRNKLIEMLHNQIPASEHPVDLLFCEIWLQ